MKTKIMSRSENGKFHGTVRCLAVAASVCLILAGCAGTQNTAADKAGGSEESTRIAGAALVRLDRAILDEPGRPEKEKAQDAGRKAMDVYEWLGIQPGMTVADLFCSGGYNTHLLSRVVGDEGKVFSIFEFYADKEALDGRLYKVDSLTERVAKNGLDNVELTMKTTDLEAGSIDVMLAVRNYHDVEWVFPGLERKEVVGAIHRALKPGGILGIVEVASDKPGWDEETHRLNEQVVIDDFTAAGFEMVGRSDILANPDDDHTTNGFEAGRHNQDRYLLKFQKPA